MLVPDGLIPSSQEKYILHIEIKDGFVVGVILLSTTIETDLLE